MKYTALYSMLANKAARQGRLDLETFVERASKGGMSLERIEQNLLRDLQEGGPIFGKFVRNIKSTAGSTVNKAYEQGDLAHTALKKIDNLENISAEELIDGIESGDADMLDLVEEELGDKQEMTWICTLIKTCHLCLPLHGISRTLAEWKDLGLEPGEIHANEGWVSDCKCKFVPTEETENRKDLVAPLLREKIVSPTGLKGSKKTARKVLQKDLDKALAARDEAMKTKEGRRTLRLLGKVEKDEDEQE